MDTATFRFDEALTFFLPRSRKNKPIVHPFDWRGSVKDMIESLGVPHPEIELLLANGVSVDFDTIVEADDQIDVYANSESATVDVSPKVPLRPPLEGRPSFILDQHLGRLAAYLRMMGYDTLYRNDYHDEELAQVSHDAGRVLLTRDVGLLKRGIVDYGYFVRSTHREKQLAELTQRYGLERWITPFKRCMKCNGLVETVSKDSVLAELKDDTAQFYQEFHRCNSCGRVYWKGPHHQRMEALMREVLSR
ncbi:MAG: Mut7-C RNAse domain-containing protein [Chloroflexota bacterium]